MGTVPYTDEANYLNPLLADKVYSDAAKMSIELLHQGDNREGSGLSAADGGK